MNSMRVVAVVIGVVGFLGSAPAQAAVPMGTTVSLRSINHPDRFVRHRSFLGELTPVSSDQDQKDSRFIARPGLAGQGVSFESVNFPGYFLRHQNFQLKLQQREDSDGYKKDATFMERPGASGKGASFESVNFPGHYIRHCSFKIFLDNNARGNTACDKTDASYKADSSFEVLDVDRRVQLRSVSFPDRFLRHRGFVGELTQLSSEQDQKDAAFIMRPGLAGQGVSFESVYYPGYFLRHQNFQLKLQAREESETFRKDATFVERAGVSGKGVSFESVNFPGHYVRHCSFKIFLDNNARGNTACAQSDATFKADSSFETIAR
jgi:hypothetical protein